MAGALVDSRTAAAAGATVTNQSAGTWTPALMLSNIRLAPWPLKKPGCMTSLDSAEKEHQFLLTRQTEQTSALQQLTLWLEQNQAIKLIAAEWNRWEAELDRYQTLNIRKTDAEIKADQLRLSITKDERNLVELNLAIDDSHKKLELHQKTLAATEKTGQPTVFRRLASFKRRA